LDTSENITETRVKYWSVVL